MIHYCITCLLRTQLLSLHVCCLVLADAVVTYLQIFSPHSYALTWRCSTRETREGESDECSAIGVRAGNAAHRRHMPARPRGPAVGAVFIYRFWSPPRARARFAHAHALASFHLCALNGRSGSSSASNRRAEEGEQRASSSQPTGCARCCLPANESGLPPICCEPMLHCTLACQCMRAVSGKAQRTFQRS